MAKFALRIEARARRRKGQSVKHIARDLGVAKSTVSYWCRGIRLTADQERRLQEFVRSRGSIGQLKAAETHRSRRLIRVQEGYVWARQMVGRLSQHNLLIMGLALYWAEGSKKGEARVIFTNSDPAMIRLMLKFFHSCCGYGIEQLTFSILVNEVHRNRARSVLRYWMGVTGAPASAFRQTTFIKTKLQKVYENHRDHFGTLKVKFVRGSETAYRLRGAIAVLSGRTLRDVMRMESSPM